MYRSTGDSYWHDIAMRTFQHACARIIWLPFHSWTKAVRLARHEMSADLNPGHDPIRQLQVNATWLYVVLLYLKRMLVDVTIDRSKRIAPFQRLSKQSGRKDAGA